MTAAKKPAKAKEKKRPLPKKPAKKPRSGPPNLEPEDLVSSDLDDPEPDDETLEPDDPATDPDEAAPSAPDRVRVRPRQPSSPPRTAAAKTGPPAPPPVNPVQVFRREGDALARDACERIRQHQAGEAYQLAELKAFDEQREALESLRSNLGLWLAQAERDQGLPQAIRDLEGDALDAYGKLERLLQDFEIQRLFVEIANVGWAWTEIITDHTKLKDIGNFALIDLRNLRGQISGFNKNPNAVLFEKLIEAEDAVRRRARIESAPPITARVTPPPPTPDPEPGLRRITEEIPVVALGKRRCWITVVTLMIAFMVGMGCAIWVVTRNASRESEQPAPATRKYRITWQDTDIRDVPGAKEFLQNGYDTSKPYGHALASEPAEIELTREQAKAGRKSPQSLLPPHLDCRGRGRLPRAPNGNLDVRACKGRRVSSMTPAT